MEVVKYTPALRFERGATVGVKVLKDERDRRKRSCIGFPWTLSRVRGILPGGANHMTYTAPWRRGFRPRKPRPIKGKPTRIECKRGSPWWTYASTPIRYEVVKKAAATCVRYCVPVTKGCVYAEAHKLRDCDMGMEIMWRYIRKVVNDNITGVEKGVWVSADPVQVGD